MAKRSIYDSCVVTFSISLLIGAFPIFVGKTGKKRLVKTNRWCTCIIILYFLFFTFMLYLATLEKNPITEGTMYNFNTLAKLLILVLTIFGVFGIYTIFFLSYYYKQFFKNIFNTIAAVDKILTKLGHQFDYSTEFVLNAALNLCGPIFTFGNVYMELWNIPRENIPPLPLVLMFCHIFPFMLIHYGESQFVIVNLLLSTRFSAINCVLHKLNLRSVQEKKCSKESKEKINWISGDFENKPESFKLCITKIVVEWIKFGISEEKILNSCIQCHDKLCDMCDVVNRIFGFLIIVGCVIQFNTIVFAFCYCYYSISIRPISTLGWFFWSVYRIYELARKAVSAHICTSEARSTIQWINKLMIHSTGQTEEKLKIFALQHTHRKVAFTALGLFPLDGSFAFTVIGAATTYIILIYQFQVTNKTC